MKGAITIDNWTKWSAFCIGNHTFVQFENNLREWVFQKILKLHEPVGRM